MTDAEIEVLLDTAVSGSDAEAVHTIRNALSRSRDDGVEAAAKLVEGWPFAVRLVEITEAIRSLKKT